MFGIKKFALCAAGIVSFAFGLNAQIPESISFNDIKGKKVDFSLYKVKTVIIVNTASLCGFTPQYKGLQALYDTYKDRGLVVLGFPSDNFMGQEYSDNAKIEEFCTTQYKVTFPMFERINVTGRDIHPLFAWLTDEKVQKKLAGKVSWNFNKFLLDGEGRLVARFDSMVDPLDKKFVAALEAILVKN